jgi:hypothetical protein
MVDMNKRITAIGLTAGLLAGAGVGVLLQHTGGAKASGGRLNFAPGNAPTGSLSPNGGIFGGDQPGDTLPGGDQGGPGLGGPDDGGPGDGGPGRSGFGSNLDAVANLLGISLADLQTALQDGQTLAQIAKAHGKTPNDVIDTLVAGVKAHFEADVASGEHTQAEADQFIAAFTSQISDFVNNGTVFPGRGGSIIGGVPGAGGFPGVGGPSDGGPNDGGPNDGGPNDGGPVGGLPVTPTTVADASI